MNHTDEALRAIRIIDLQRDALTLRRARAVVRLVVAAGSQVAAGALLGISQPAVAKSVTRAQSALFVEDFDVIEIAEDTANYGRESVGRLAVQHEGECMAIVDNLEEAVAHIEAQTGEAVTAVPQANYFSGRRWTVA